MRKLTALFLFALLSVLAADVHTQQPMPTPPGQALTPSRAMASDANGVPSSATPTLTELNRLSGVTSGVQTQLDAKLPLAGGTLTGNLNLGSNDLQLDTAGTLVIDDANGTGVIRSMISNVVITRQSVGIMDLRLSDDGAAAGPSFRPFRISASPAVSDDLGEVAFYGRDTGAADQLYGRINARIDNATAGAETGQLRFSVQNGASEFLAAQAKITGWRFPYANATTVPILDANKDLQSSVVTPTELAYLSGVNGLRVKLTANRTYYVATTGSDSNDCLAIITPCLTMQNAANIAQRNVDTAGFDVIVQLADGTYTSGLNVSRPLVGGGSVILTGNVGSPANVIVSPTGAEAITASGSGSVVRLTGLELRTITSGGCIRSTAYAQVEISTAVRFGACVGAHMQADSFGAVLLTSNYTISGGSVAHFSGINQGRISTAGGITVTLTGTPAFSVTFASSSVLSTLYVPGITFSGAATGSRYSGNLNSVIFTNGGGSSYFPGNSAGAVASGAQYN